MPSKLNDMHLCLEFGPGDESEEGDTALAHILEALIREGISNVGEQDIASAEMAAPAGSRSQLHENTEPPSSPSQVRCPEAELESPLQQQPDGSVRRVSVAAAVPETSMDDRTPSATWPDSFFQFDTQFLSTNDYEALNLGPDFTGQRDLSDWNLVEDVDWPMGTPPFPSSPDNSGSIMPLPTLLQLPEMAVVQPTAGASNCECVGALVQVLEHVGQSQMDSNAIGIDTHLMSLQQATQICGAVVSCSKCSTCPINPILLATIIRLLTSISDQLGSLCGLLHEGQPLGDTAVMSAASDVDVGAIWVGRYKLEGPAMRTLIVQQVSYMHLAELRDLLQKLKQRVGTTRRVPQQVINAETKVRNICSALRDLIDTYKR